MISKCKLYTAFKAQVFTITDNFFDTINWLNMVDVFPIRVIRLDENPDTSVYMFGFCFSKRVQFTRAEVNAGFRSPGLTTYASESSAVVLIATTG
jgi:hypothetical protein